MDDVITNYITMDDVTTRGVVTAADVTTYYITMYDITTYDIIPAPPIPAAPAEGSVRLLNGSGPHEGRLEIFHERRWGSVCDDGWDSRDGDVACRMLGFPGAADVFRMARFGQGGTAKGSWESIPKDRGMTPYPSQGRNPKSIPKGLRGKLQIHPKGENPKPIQKGSRRMTPSPSKRGWGCPQIHPKETGKTSPNPS